MGIAYAAAGGVASGAGVAAGGGSGAPGSIGRVSSSLMAAVWTRTLCRTCGIDQRTSCLTNRDLTGNTQAR